VLTPPAETRAASAPLENEADEASYPLALAPPPAAKEAAS